MLEFVELSEKYIDEAVQLAFAEYRQECKKVPALMQDDFSGDLHGIISSVFASNCGRVALENGKVVGYLAFWRPRDGFFGKVKGAFCPLGGSAFGGDNREKLASMLFEEVAGEMTENNICSYALSRYAHDDAVGKSFILNGFGIRCSDAILRLKDRNIVEKPDPQLTYCELTGRDKRRMKHLQQKLIAHLAAAPTFFPSDLSDFDEWFDDEEMRIFAAMDGDRIIGYMAFRGEGETFVSGYPEMMNICGAYVDERYRNKNIAPSLLEYVCHMCEQEGMQYLGVDCETLNPTALRFWGKYFQNYTYSYARRIDERVVGYQEYMKQFF